MSNQIIADGDEPTITRDVGVQPAGFSWEFSGPTKTPPLSAKLKLTATVVIGLLLAMLGGFLVKGLLAQFGGGPDSQQVASTLRSTADVAPAVEPTVNATAEIKTTSHPTIDQAEEELRKLHERRIGASSSDRLTILQLIANTEKQYPDDFRFPYERAKLAINGVETRSHDEAFNALSLAAGTAIKANKADEMLKGLETDRMSDFHKLSHGHREWMQIIEALKRKDATLLGSN